MPTPPRPSLSVLVVDDVPDAADSLATLLALHGYAARFACSAEDALRDTTRDPPDVVILDLGMPGMDGWELARRFREQAQRKRPLLVAVTGFGTEVDRRKSVQAGIDLHLVKPVEPAVLVGELERFAEVIDPA